MPLRKLKVLFLFPLHLLSPLQLPVLFATCSFLFLAFSSHFLTSAFMVYPMQARTLTKKCYYPVHDLLIVSRFSTEFG
jgi:hypothetical protein